MRIAATRSFRIYGLEGPNPKFRLVSIRFESRSTEVDRGRDSVWAISRRPEACRSSESHQNADLLMLYPVEVVAWLSSGKIMAFLGLTRFNICRFFKDESSREHQNVYNEWESPESPE